MKISYMSLGCKVNLYESVAIINDFVNNGFELAEFDDVCEVYLINTCTVTQTSDSKSKKMIRQAIKRNKDAIICVMGCFAQLNSNDVCNIQGVNIVCGTSNRTLILPTVLKMLETNDRTLVNLTQSYNEICYYEDLSLDHYDHKTRGFVKIQDGCENFCSYCAIPYSRGRFRSRDSLSVIKEIQLLSDRGMKEIVLTGINTGAYGKDNNSSLSMLLEDIIKNVSNLGRLRISSIEATEITIELLEVMKKYSNHFCMHLHIPVQGGSDEILKKMNRKYDIKYYRNKLALIRSYFPLINITADVMVGFNGETDELFAKAYDFIDSCKYGETHIFPYSPRPNTLAYLESKKIKFKDAVADYKKKTRVNDLLVLNEINGLEYRKNFIDKIVEVIVEKIENGFAFGHSSNYLEVKFKAIKAKENDLVNVIITKAGYPISEGVEKDVIE